MTTPITPRSAEKPRAPFLRATLIGVTLATLYYIFFRLLSFLPYFKEDHAGGAILLSFSFLLLGPLVAGFLCMYAPRNYLPGVPEPFTLTQCFLIPWIPVAINIVLCLAVAWEGRICVAFILPIALVFTSFGGLLAWLVNRHTRTRHNATVACLAVLPLLLSMVETKLNQPLQVRTVATQIRIHAPAETIWRNIERVPYIRSPEVRPSWSNLVGFPRPVEATLSYEGVGGVRNASFEHGLSFVETVNAWEPGRRIAFTIKADTADIPTTTLDQHVTIGGRFFDVLNGEYTIEPIVDPGTRQPTGDFILHLASRERLSTDFNLYAALWSDGVMRDMQNNILQVIRHRCETQANMAQTPASGR